MSVLIVCAILSLVVAVVAVIIGKKIKYEQYTALGLALTGLGTFFLIAEIIL